MEASQSSTTAATTTANDADEDNPKEVVCFYNIEGQKVPKNVTKLIVGPDVIRIDQGAFDSYEFLKEADVSKATSLQIIDKNAFRKCNALVCVKLPSNLRTIGDYAFHNCTSLEEADLSKLHALETIQNGAFAYCSALALVKWSPNLKTIGVAAFAGCTSLKVADMSKLHALETIGRSAFNGCSALALVKWPPNIKTIGAWAFRNCRSLKEVDMSKLHDLETIGEQTFAWCTALSIVKWPPNIKTAIAYNAFFLCRALQDVMIPLRHHWFVRELPLNETKWPFETKLRSVDMQGHDLKKAIRIKNLYPRATPRLTMDRLVSMYAKSPLTVAQLENAAQSDESVTEEDWAEARFGDLQRLEGIQKAFAGSIFNLLHWYVGKNAVVENLFVNRKKRK